LLATAPVGLLTAAALFSSFGAHWGGLLDSVLAYEVYLRRGSEGGIHAHPWHFYLELLAWFRPARGFFWSEGLILGLAAVGALVALGRRKREFAVSPCDSQGSAAFAERKATVAPASLPGDSALSPLVFGRFLTFYTLTLTLLYCLIPYKTPWCMLSFLHGMILLAGLGAAALVGGAWRAPRMFVSGAAAVGEGRSARWWPAAVGALLAAMVAGALIAAAGQLAWQAYALNFRFPADQRNPYVYAHTSTDALKLAVQIEGVAAVSPAGRGLTIHVVVPNNYWPLPWYLRRFDQERIGCWDDVEKWRRAAAAGPPPSVVIFSTEIQAEVDAALLAAYNRQMIYGLRPDVLLAVYVREDLWRAFVAAQSGK
jgi:hypothetical protein